MELEREDKNGREGGYRKERGKEVRRKEDEGRTE